MYVIGSKIVSLLGEQNPSISVSFWGNVNRKGAAAHPLSTEMGHVSKLAVVQMSTRNDELAHTFMRTLVAFPTHHRFKGRVRATRSSPSTVYCATSRPSLQSLVR